MSVKNHVNMGGYIGTENTTIGGIHKLEETTYRVITQPFSYETLTFTAQGSGTLSITGNGTTSVSIFKTGGSAAWDTQAYTTQAYQKPLTLEFARTWVTATDNGLRYSMLSLNEDPTTNNSYTSLDHAAYPYYSVSYSVHHNGTNNMGPSYNPANKFYIVYGSDNTIKHYCGPVLLYSASYSAANVYIDSSFYSVNASEGGFSNIRLSKGVEWNGFGYKATG